MSKYCSDIKTDFTVLMAVYYKETPALLDRALLSVIKNTLQPSSIVLVVDGPVDDLLNAVIYKYQELLLAKLKVYRLQNNEGLANALNKGLELVETEFVARADSDDYNLPFRFQVQQKFIDSGFDLFGSAIQEVDICGNNISIRSVPLTSFAISKFIKRRSPFNHMTVFFRTSLARDCGGYPCLDLREDYGLWVKMIQSGAKATNSEMVLVNATTGDDFYRRRGGSRSVKAEIAMQRFLVECGMKSISLATVDVVLKSLIFLAPSQIRAFFYKKILRKHK